MTHKPSLLPRAASCTLEGGAAPQRADTHRRGLRAATPGEMWPGGLRALGGPGSEKGLRVTQQVTRHLVTVPSPSGLLSGRGCPCPGFLPLPWSPLPRWVPPGPRPPALAFLPSSLAQLPPSLGLEEPGPCLPLPRMLRAGTLQGPHRQQEAYRVQTCGVKGQSPLGPSCSPPPVRPWGSQPHSLRQWREDPWQGET